MLPIVAAAAKLLPFAAVVPEVLRAFGGQKQAEAAGALVRVAQAISGEQDPERAVAAVQASPELQLEMQRLLSVERLEFERLAVERERIAADDRASARERETRAQDGTVRVLAYMIVGTFLAAVGALLFSGVTVDSALAGALIGYLSAKAEQVVAYYYGSSAGSKAKDALIKR